MGIVKLFNHKDLLFQDLNNRLQSSGGEKFSKNFVDLELKVSEIRAGLDSVTSSTRLNTLSLGNLSLKLNQIKVGLINRHFLHIHFPFQLQNFGSVDKFSTENIISSTSAPRTKTSKKSSKYETLKVVHSTTETNQQNE